MLLWAAAIFVFGAIAGTLAQNRYDWKALLGTQVSKTRQLDTPKDHKDQSESGGRSKPATKQTKQPTAIAPGLKDTGPKQTQQAQPAQQTQAQHAQPTQQPQTSQTQQPRQPAQAQLPRMALVIDDLGHAAPALVQRLCSLNVPLTVAVLPYLQHSKESARIAKSRGMEVILHMPMEPLGYPGTGKDPGPGAVLFSQGEADVRKNVARAIADTPFAVGLNNHMGSRVTPDRTRMTWVLDEVKKSGLYFIDSRTEKDSVALDVAKELGIPALERKVFLDDSLDAAEMTRQWERAVAMTKHDPLVVIIGHIHPETVEFLEKAIPAAKREVAFVRASEMVR